jgi:hypothetical protein
VSDYPVAFPIEDYIIGAIKQGNVHHRNASSMDPFDSESSNNKDKIDEFYEGLNKRCNFCVETAITKTLVKPLLGKLRSCCTSASPNIENFDGEDKLSTDVDNKDANDELERLRLEWCKALKEYQLIWTCVINGAKKSPSRFFF